MNLDPYQYDFQLQDARENANREYVTVESVRIEISNAKVLKDSYMTLNRNLENASLQYNNMKAKVELMLTPAEVAKESITEAKNQFVNSYAGAKADERKAHQDKCYQQCVDVWTDAESLRMRLSVRHNEIQRGITYTNNAIHEIDNIISILKEKEAYLISQAEEDNSTQ